MESFLKKYSIIFFSLLILFLCCLTVTASSNKQLQSEIKSVQGEETEQEKLKKEFEQNLRLAQEGDSGAQNLIGINYAEGEGVEQDDEEAIKWFLRSAQQGNSYAACNLALHYGSGRGVKKDIVETLKWCFISHSLDGLKCHPDDFINQLKPTKSQQKRASKLAIVWLRNHPNFTNNFGEKPWMDKAYKFKSRTFRF